MTFPNKLTRHSKEEKHLLRFTYQQIIYLVCTATKSRETERDRQTHKKKRERDDRAKSELFLNLILWVNGRVSVSILKFSVIPHPPKFGIYLGTILSGLKWKSPSAFLSSLIL